MDRDSMSPRAVDGRGRGAADYVRHPFWVGFAVAVGLAMLINAPTRSLGFGILTGTTVSLVVFGVYLVGLARALADT